MLTTGPAALGTGAPGVVAVVAMLGMPAVVVMTPAEECGGMAAPADTCIPGRGAIMGRGMTGTACPFMFIITTL